MRSVGTVSYQRFIFCSNPVICHNATKDVAFSNARMANPTQNGPHRVKVRLFNVVVEVEGFDFCDTVNNDIVNLSDLQSF